MVCKQFFNSSYLHIIYTSLWKLYYIYTILFYKFYWKLTTSMNQNSRKDEKNNDQRMYRLRKVSFWEKYGVQRFPYCGRHRNTPFVYRSVDGGIIISNDLFGMTIRQFDRSYKACLNRRKTHKQYLENGTDNDNGIYKVLLTVLILMLYKIIISL